MVSSDIFSNPVHIVEGAGGGKMVIKKNPGGGGNWVLVSDGERVLNEESLRGSVRKNNNVDEHWLLGSRE